MQEIFYEFVQSSLSAIDNIWIDKYLPGNHGWMLGSRK